MKKITIIMILCWLWSFQTTWAQVNGDVSPLVQQIQQMQGVVKFEPIKLFKHKSSGSIQGIGQYQAMELDKLELSRLFENKYTAIALQIPVSNQSEITILLIPSNILADDFKTTLTDREGLRNFSFTYGLYYKGIILNSSGNSLASIALYENEISGVICDQSGNWNLGKIGDSDTEYGFYNDKTFQLPVKYPCTTEFSNNVDNDDSGNSGNKLVSTSKCVKIFFDCDFDFYTYKGNSTTDVVQYALNLFNMVSLLYGNESVSVTITEIHVWTIQDPYSSASSSAALTDFTSQYPTVNGNVGHLLSVDPGGLGGRADINVLCNGHGYSDINANYTAAQLTFPTYTWDAMVVTHELGHNFGSAHTHDCVWNGNNTAIDGCGPTAGYASSPGGCPTAPLPGLGGGTIMSYCHLLGTVGIDLANGFGIQPGDKIRTQIANTGCVNACLNTCLPYVSVGNPVDAFNYGQFSASDILWANSLVDVNAQAQFTATNLMILNPGFVALDGSIFHGLISACSPQPLANNGGQSKADSDKKGSGSFVLFPNPCQEYINLTFAEMIGNSEIVVYDMNGQSLISINQNKREDDSTIHITTSKLSPGVYYLEIKTQGNSFRQKFVKI